MKVQNLIVAVCLSLIPYSSQAGTDLKIKVNEFTGAKTGQYDLEVGPECSLLKTITSEIMGCSILTVKADKSTPTLMLMTKSRGLSITRYRNLYSAGIPTVITYNNGTELKRRFPVRLDADILSSGRVMESIIIQLGSIKKEMLTINSMRFQFGSNEYFILLDKELTRKILEI